MIVFITMIKPTKYHINDHTSSYFLSCVVNSSLMSSSSQSSLHCLASILAGTFLLSYANLGMMYHPLRIIRNRPRPPQGV
jgi:hypothetical protein